MTRRKEDIEQTVEAYLDRLGLFDCPPAEDVARSRARTLDRLLTRAAVITRPPVAAFDAGQPAQAAQRRWSLWMSAAAVPCAIALVLAFWPRAPVGIVESTAGALYEIRDQQARGLDVGAELTFDESITSRDGAGAILRLQDGTSVEMRADTTLSLRRLDNGLRIELDQGGVLVNAAKQPAGRYLYVRTRDVVVAVVGTVFLVNAEEGGSRVAVVEGEVRVHQGATERAVLPGEQVTTNPSAPASLLTEQIAWSRNAGVLLAKLQRSGVVPPASAPAQNATELDEAFELASIRPTRFTVGGERGGGGGNRSQRPAGEPCGDHPHSFFLTFDPGRAIINDMTLYGLAAWAYGVSCRPHYGSDFLVAGSGWIKDEGFDIQALIPEGPPAFTAGRELSLGRGRTRTEQVMTPRFQGMLRTLLADRFKLVVRREMRDMPAYVLTVARGGSKLKAWKEGDPLCFAGGDCRRASNRGAGPESVMGLKLTLADLTEQLVQVTGRRVIDRTGIAGEFNYSISFAWFERPGGQPPPPPGSPREPGSPPPTDVSLFTVLEQDLGLRLEATRLPMEVFVVDRAERPKEN